MLIGVGVGVGERTEAEFRKLFDRSGFAVDSVRSLLFETGLFDCRAV